MEYIYAALLLHKTGKTVDEAHVKKVLEAAGTHVEEGRVKALLAKESISTRQSSRQHQLRSQRLLQRTPRRRTRKRRSLRRRKRTQRRALDPSSDRLLFCSSFSYHFR